MKQYKGVEHNIQVSFGLARNENNSDFLISIIMTVSAKYKEHWFYLTKHYKSTVQCTST